MLPPPKTRARRGRRAPEWLGFPIELVSVDEDAVLVDEQPGEAAARLERELHARGFAGFRVSYDPRARQVRVEDLRARSPGRAASRAAWLKPGASTEQLGPRLALTPARR